MSTFTRIESFVSEHCCNCGMAFAMTEDLNRRLRADGGSFFCPNGHSQYYTKSNETRLKEQLETERQSRQFWRDQAQTTERRLSAAKGQLTKTKNRIAKGICPCCNRSFTDLRRHMESKHPEFAKP